MGISLAITTDSWGVDDKSWLASRKGFDTCRSITLDLTLFTAAGGFTLDYIPSGVTLGKITATGLYGPYSNAAVDGRETATGHLFDAARLTDSDGNVFTRAGVALFWEGIVLISKLPVQGGTGLGNSDAAGRLEMANFIRYEA